MTLFDLKNRAILVVDDDPLLRKRLQALLLQQEARVSVAENLAEAREACREQDFDLVLLDINLPDGRGLDLLKEDVLPLYTAVVVMTAEGGLDSALEALRNGASDYLCKPFDPFEVPLVYSRCRQRLDALRLQEFEQQASPTGEVFVGQGMQEVQDRMSRIVEADRRTSGNQAPVLITGETGTGKSTVARLLHDQGPRRAQPFVAINCAVLPEQLAESELFGHERGAFTDARERRIGLFEAAEGGTLFLDEVPSLSPGNQAKLLTALEQGEIRRIGATASTRVNVRIMAATLQNLDQLVSASRFREDLYHRLNVLPLHLPPLRSCRDDIEPLARFLLRKLARRYGRTGMSISEAGVRRLTAYAWPGNIRELEHELERQLVLAGDEDLDFEHLETPPAAAPGGGSAWMAPGWVIPDQGFSIVEAEMTLIEKALSQCGNNISAAARLLGVNRDFIRYRLEKRESQA